MGGTAAGGSGRTTYGNATDEVVQMGAGAGGGGGTHGRFACSHAGTHTNCGATTPDGQGGQPGGGRIALVCATGDLTIAAAGILSANGGAGGKGGCDNHISPTCAKSGAGGGGGGAGGGILVKGNWVTVDGTVRANGGTGGAGGDGGQGGSGCIHRGGDGGVGGGAGRIKVVAVNLTEVSPTYQLTGGAGGAGGCGGGGNSGVAGTAGGGGTVAYVPCSDICQTLSGTVTNTLGAPIAGVTVRAVITGRSGASGVSSGAGVYTIDVGTVAGDRVLVYLDTGVGVQKGTTATVVNGSDLLTLDIRQDRVIVRNDNGGTTSNNDLRIAKGAVADTDIKYAADGSNNVTIDPGLLLDVRSNYTPAANITTSGAGGMLATSGTVSLSSLTLTLGSAGLVAASGTTLLLGSGGLPTFTSSDTGTPTRYPVYLKGSVSINSLSVNYAEGVQFGTHSGIGGGTNIEDANDTDTVSATISLMNEVTLANSTKGMLFRNMTNVTSASSPITVRSGSFDSVVTYNARLDAASPAPNWPYYIVIENAIGAKGANSNPPNTGPTPSGEDWDSDPEDGNPGINAGAGYVLWKYFNWKWLGGTSTAWNLAANWAWQGTGPAPEAYPGATGPTSDPNVDAAIAGRRSIWIPLASNGCVQDQSYNVVDLSLTAGGALTSGAAMVLGIYGNAFKASGGTFTPLVGNTVRFAGTATQVVILIGGGAGSFYNLDINKTGGSSASLGADLTVTNATTVTAGTFEASTYVLTQDGALTVSAGATLSLTASGGVTRTGGPSTALTNNGAVTMSSTSSIDWSPGTGTVTQNAGATWTMSGTSAVSLGTGTNTLNGTLSLNGGVTVRVPDSATVNISGTLTSFGSTPSITKTSAGAGGFTFNVVGGATLDVSKLDFSYAGLNGFTIDATATAVTYSAFNNVAFTNVRGTPGAGNPTARRRHMYLKGATGAANVTLTGLSFDNTYLNGGTNDGYDVVTEWPNTVTVTMSQWGGTGTGNGNLGSGAGTDQDYDISENTTLANVLWNRLLTWNGKYRNKRTVTITPVSALPNGYTVTTAAFSTTGAALASGDDVRVLWSGGGTPTEIDRTVTGANTASTVVEFRVQEAAGIPAVNTNYTIYYGASVGDAAGPPANKNNVYAYFSDFEATNGGFSVITISGTSTWDWGDPTGTGSPASPTSGTNCWGTNLNGNYNNDECTAIACPAINLTGGSGCVVTLQAWWSINDLSGGKRYDGFRYEQYNGASWVTTSMTVAPVYDGTVSTASTSCLSSFSANVLAPAAWGANTLTCTLTNAGWQFRVRLGADDSAAKPGVFIDDVKIVKSVATAPSAVAGGATAMAGAWNDAFNWRVGGTTNQSAAPTANDDCVIDGMFGSPVITPTLNTSPTIASLSLGETAASTLNLGGAGNYTLTTSAGVTLGASSTLDATSRTAGAITVGQDLDVAGGTWTMPGAAPASPFMAVGRDLTASATITWTGSTAVDVQVVRNVTVTGALRFPGILRMVGTGSGSPISTVNSLSTAAFRRVEINRASPGAGSGYTVNLGGTSYWLCEVMNVDGGVVVVPVGSTLEAKDQAGATFDTTSANGLEWIRFSTGGSAAANRVLRLTGGTVKAGRLGSATPAAAPPYAPNNNNGRLDLQASGGTIETGYFLFKNNTDAANTSDVILAAGTVRVSADWDLSTVSGTAPSFAATAGTVIFNGTGAQSVTHSPSGGTPSFNILQVGEGANGPTVNATQDITCGDLDVAEGTFAPGAGRTVTRTGAATTDIQAGGTLQLGAATVLKLAGGATINVNVGGTLSTSGTSTSSRARIENDGAGTYSCSVSGTMDVNYVTIANLAATGIVVNSAATLTGWTGVRFTSGAAGGLYLDLSGATVATTLPSTMNLCQFDAGPTNNVRGAGSAATHSNVTFGNWAGARGGEQFETNDQLDLVDWGAGAAVVLRTDNPLDADVATFATLQDAVLAADPVNNLIEVRDNVIRDETINLSAVGFRIILDGVVLRPPAGSTAIIGSGIAAREVLRNLVLIRDASSATPLLQNVANVIHCDVLGAFTTANPLITVTGGNTCLIENSIVGNPGSWQADADDPISNGGALTVNYSFVDRGVVYPGLNNANANPQLQNWDPIATGSGLYDVHLKPISTCIDYAPAPSIAVETDFDRGLDFNTPDQNPGFGNPRRPIDARPDSTDGGGPDPSWDNNFAPANTYDVGADELGPLVTGTGNKPQGVPLWTNRAGAGIVSDPDSFSTPITSFTFSPAVMYLAENMNVNQAGHDIRLVAYRMDDLAGDGALDILTTLDLDASGVQKVHHITVIGAGTQDNLYVAVDLDGDADTTADSILALQYTPSPPTLALRGGWAPNPASLAGSGTIGRLVIDQSAGNSILYFARGDGQLYRRDSALGTAPVASGNWLGTGQLNLAGYLGKFDAEGSLFAGKFNNSIYAPTNQHANEIVRIETPTGNLLAAKDCGAGNRNHYGFNLMSQSVFVTGADQYVWRIHEDTFAFNPWPAAVWPWESEPMGANVKTTTRAQMFRIVDANVRVGAGQTVYKFRRDTGVITDDSDLAGDDWGPGRSFRGNIITAPTLIGGTGKDYTVSPDGRRCGKIVFGTDQGYCYVVGYIRATLATDVEENDEPQPASSTIVGYDVLDGRPYHGFPYRIPGVKIVSLSLLTSSTVGKSVIVFITDNGWAYGFIEPY